MSRVLLLLPMTCLMALAVSVPAASAQSMDRIAANLNNGGVYVESGADGSAADFAGVVQQLAASGVDLRIASLADEPNNAESVADDLRDLTGATVLVITPESLAASSTVYSASAINAALDGTDFSNLTSGALEFGQRLGQVSGTTATTTAAVPTTAVPVADGGAAATTDTSGGGSGVLVFFVVVIGLIGGSIWLVRRSNRKKVSSELTQRRAAVSDELAAIGADIVALADRVELAENSEATAHFRTGNAEYLELQNKLDTATSLWEVTQVDYAADTTAWHLDAAEAIISGAAVPPEPPRPDLTVSRPPEQREVEREAERADERHRVDSRLDNRQRSPRVEPRQQRRDQWNPPKTRGSSLGDIVTGILVGGMLNGGGGGRRAPRRYDGGGSLGSFGGFGGSGGSGSRSRGGSGSISRGGSGSRSR